MRSGVDRVAPAHAIADGADDFGVRSLLSFSIGEQRLGVFHHKGNAERVHQPEHPLALGRFRVGWNRTDLHHAGAVIHVRQHHVVARCTEPARHVAQLLADRRRIHVEDDDRKRSAALGMGDEGGGGAVLGGNLDLLIDHGRSAGGLLILFFVCAFITIARKPEHDKAGTGMPGLN
jgi:hypothetical protein